MKYKEKTRIIEKRVEGPYLYLKVKTEQIARESKAGQFVNVRVAESYDPLLRRPFSIMSAEGDELELMVLVRGKGTELLANKSTGDSLNIVGPLGNHFPVIEDRCPVFIAGGIGIAPFYFLSKQYGKCKPKLIFGAKSKEFVPDLSPFEETCRVEVATDDGSFGIKGTVIDLVDECDFMNCVFYACGPEPMLKALANIFSSRPDSIVRVEGYFSLETYMGCGFGACKGCAVKMFNGETKLCCMDGPIFPWNEVLL